MSKYRLSWFNASLLLCKEWFQGYYQDCLIEGDEKRKRFYENEIRMVDDVLRIVNKISDTKPILLPDLVRIPLNSDQKNWLRVLFSWLLKQREKVLNEERANKDPTITIIDTEGNIDMIKYFLKTADIHTELCCNTCIIENDPERPKARETDSYSW